MKSINIYKSKYNFVEIPKNKSIEELVFKNNEKYQNDDDNIIALVDAYSKRQLTYKQLKQDINIFSNNLFKLLIQNNVMFKQNNLENCNKLLVGACLLENCIEYPTIFHGILKIGGSITTLNPLMKENEIAKQFNETSAKFIFLNEKFLEIILSEISNQKDNKLKLIFVVNNSGINKNSDSLQIENFQKNNSKIKIVKFDDCLKETPISESDTKIQKEYEDQMSKIKKLTSKERIAAIPFSSGTSGYPKGVLLSHYNIIANLKQCEELLYINRDQKVLAILPMFHIYGLFIFIMMSLMRRATIVILSKFEPNIFLKTIEKYRISILHIVPPIVVMLAKSPIVDNFDISSLEIVFSGAAPLGQEIAEKCAKRLGSQCNILQGYGMTELSPVALLSHKNCSKFSSCGRLICNTEARIVDVDTGNDCQTGEKGEIQIKGPQVMKGYLNDTLASQEIIDQDQWLHTGDIGYIDSDGDFFIVDRVKELIKYNAYQVAPAELEDCLLKHEFVRDCAVVSWPNIETGEIPKAFVVLKPNKKIEPIKLIDFVAKQVASYKKIREVEFIDAIPKSASGKILRRVLKQKVENL